MPLKVHGKTTGPKPNQRQRLNRLYHRKVPKHEIISGPLAATICELSAEIGRQIGVTLDRGGHVRHVIVGDAGLGAGPERRLGSFYPPGVRAVSRLRCTAGARGWNTSGHGAGGAS